MKLAWAFNFGSCIWEGFFYLYLRRFFCSLPYLTSWYISWCDLKIHTKKYTKTRDMAVAWMSTLLLFVVFEKVLFHISPICYISWCDLKIHTEKYCKRRDRWEEPGGGERFLRKEVRQEVQSSRHVWSKVGTLLKSELGICRMERKVDRSWGQLNRPRRSSLRV